MMLPNTPICAADIKKDAWLSKSFLVLIKRKVRLGKVSRNAAFNELMNALESDANLYSL